MNRFPPLLLALCLAGCPSTPTLDAGADAGNVTLGLNEVGVLLPLPQTPTELDAMLKPTDVGAQGALVPEFAHPPPALVQNLDRAEALGALRVVALRTAPCDPFVGETNLAQCQRVLHVVLQPLVFEGGQAQGRDASLHVMYRLDDAQYERLLGGLLELATLAPVDRRLPFQVHPVISQQGYAGAAWASLKATVLAVAGQKTLERTAYMALRATTDSTSFGKGWLFSGADFHDDRAHRVVVATTTDSEQHFGNNASTTQAAATESDYLGDFIPRTALDGVLGPVIDDSTIARTASASAVQAAVDQAVDLENPLKFTLDSADCVSCHVANNARAWAASERQLNPSMGRAYANADFDLTNTSGAQRLTNSLRGIGWYGRTAAISQRSINDLAAAASFIATNDLKGGAIVHHPATGHAASDGGVPALFTREPSLTLPPMAATVTALAHDVARARLLGVVGTRVFSWDLGVSSPSPTVVADLSTSGLTTVDAFSLTLSGGFWVLGGGQAVTFNGAGQRTGGSPLSTAGVTFTGSWALGADGHTVVEYETGPGTKDADGVTRLHLAVWDVSASPAGRQLSLPDALLPAPPEVGAFNLGSVLVSPDGARALVFHVIHRTAWWVDLATGAATAVDEDSLYRSVTSAQADQTLLVQAASFDQTVPVYRWQPDGGLRSLVELPAGQNLGAVATDGTRVFAVQGGSALMFPGFPGDGGFPGFPGGDGGFPGFPLDGGFPGFPGAGGDGGVTVLVYRLAPEVLAP